MTIDINPAIENPRWTLCRVAFGREPAGWEFSLWIMERWREFGEHLGIKRRPLDSVETTLALANDPRWRTVHADFDAWLLAQVQGAAKG